MKTTNIQQVKNGYEGKNSVDVFEKALEYHRMKFYVQVSNMERMVNYYVENFYQDTMNEFYDSLNMIKDAYESFSENSMNGLYDSYYDDDCLEDEDKEL